MTIKTSTLRPGLLVSLKTSVTGNVKYSKEDIETDHVDDGGRRVAEWQTTRVIADPDEYDRARKVRAKAQSTIGGVCARSAFGLLCPETAAEELGRCMDIARRLVDEFNETAALTRVHVYMMVGRIAPDDVEAVKAINSEIRDLLGDMERGLRNFDVKAIREAASRAKELGSMLSPDAAARVQLAIDAARMSAKKLVQAGDTVARELDRRTIATVTEARTAFLDLDDSKPIAAPTVEQRAIDLAPAAEAAPRREPGSRMIEV